MADTPTLPEGGDPQPSGAQPESASPSAPESMPAAATPVTPEPAPAPPNLAEPTPAEPATAPTPTAEPTPTAAGPTAEPTPAAATGTAEPTSAEPATAPSPTAEPTPTAAGPTAEPTPTAATGTAEPAPTAEPTPTAAGPTAEPTPAAAAAAASAEATARQAANEITTRGRTFWNRLDPTTRRPTVILGAILLIAVLGSQFLNALIPVPAGATTGGGGGGGSGTNTIQLGGGGRVTPPAGWTVVGPSDNLQGVELQKGAVTVDVMVAAFSGTPQDLLQTYVGRYLNVSASQLTVGDIAVGPGPNGHLTASAFYVGIFFEVGALQGVVATQVWGNVGVIVDAWAPQGQLQSALDEIETIIGTIEVR